MCVRRADPAAVRESVVADLQKSFSPELVDVTIRFKPTLGKITQTADLLLNDLNRRLVVGRIAVTLDKRRARSR